MDLTLLATLGFVTLLLQLYLRMSVGIAMMRVGTVGIYLIRPAAALPKLAGEILAGATSYPLTIIPPFILIGNLAGVSGKSREIYGATHAWLARFRGGSASAWSWMGLPCLC